MTETAKIKKKKLFHHEMYKRTLEVNVDNYEMRYKLIFVLILLACNNSLIFNVNEYSRFVVFFMNLKSSKTTFLLAMPSGL